MNEIIERLTQARDAACSRINDELKESIPRLQAAMEAQTIPQDVPEWLLIGSLAAALPDGSICWDTLAKVLAGKTFLDMAGTLSAEGNALEEMSWPDLLLFVREAWAGLKEHALAGAQCGDNARLRGGL